MAGAPKYRPSLHLPIATTAFGNRDASHHSSSKGRTSMSSNHPTFIDDSYLVSTSECAPPALTFGISRETSISMNLCGQVVTYDLKTLGPSPQVIIELLKATKSEIASWMTVGAFYRRQGEPRNGISMMKAFIEQMKARGIQDDSEELRPAFLLLSGCETDLARLAKTRKEPDFVLRGHYTAAQEYLQKVFGRADHLRNAERTHTSFDEQALFGSLSRLDARMEGPRGFSPQPNPRTLEREIQSLHESHNAELARLKTLKRKLEDDYSYERDIRRKYQRRLDDLEQECESARKMERYALEQIKREVASRRKAEERAESERKMRQELIQISGKRFGFEAENIP